MTGRKPQRGRDGVCKYPTLEDVVEEAGLKEVENYVSHLQNTVAHFIATRPIMNLFSSGGAVTRATGIQAVVISGRVR